jgi:multidrug efflux pump subunit AcrB
MSRILESINKGDIAAYEEGYTKRAHGIRKHLVLLLVVILVLAISIGIVAFVLSGGLMPNVNKGTSVSTLVIPLPLPSPKLITSFSSLFSGFTHSSGFTERC